MNNYKHILLAVELNPETDGEITAIASNIAKKNGADVSLVHAIEYLGTYGAAYGIAISSDIEDMLLQTAQKDIKQLGESLGIPSDRRIVKFGTAKSVILEAADKFKTDLIIIGSHGRHGINILLGSTANAVLHGANCDVLAVRLKEGKK